MSVGLVGRSGTGLVLLDVVLGQEDPVLQVGEGGAEVLGLVGLPLLVQPVTLRYTVRHLHTEIGNTSEPLNDLNGTQLRIADFKIIRSPSSLKH